MRVAADIYALSPHACRSDWTWFAGLADWMDRLMVDSRLDPMKVTQNA